MNRILSVLVLIILCSSLFSQTKHAKDDGRKIRIPVVFHVVHTNIIVTDSLITDELRRLNLDYSAKNDMSVLDNEFRHLVGNPNIEFYLLDTMLQTNGIKGVSRVKRKRNVTPIDSETCLNVVVNNTGNVTIGDIVYIDDVDIAHPDRALTHESGHWLGLSHIWGKHGNCNVGRNALHDDGIDDTPEQGKCTCMCYGPPCPPPPPSQLTYNGHKIMYNNWMDYNGCRCMFTIKQAIVMRNTVIEEMSSLFK